MGTFLGSYPMVNACSWILISKP